MEINLERAAELLKNNDDILVLCHAHPDGDTLGCGYALLHMLQALDKRCILRCADTILPKYDFMKEGLKEIEDFEPKFIVSVDVADIKLLSDAFAQEYSGKIDLCIDHHGSNVPFAKHYYVESSSAAAAEILVSLADLLGVQIDKHIADCLYTGIATDTGCFKFSNTTARTHILAARLIECGADYAQINRVFFDTKSRGYALLERMALDSLELHFSDRCAVITVTQDMFEKSGACDGETDAIPSLSRQIEGVLAGVTLKETKERDAFKISVRTHSPIDASKICRRLGGGGHVRASGAKLHGTKQEVTSRVLESVKQELDAL